MPITVACDCGHQFRVRDEYAGKKAQCPACGDPVAIPLADFPESSADFSRVQGGPSSATFPGAGRSSARWFAGLDSGLFGLGRLSGLACLLVGLIFVLTARGCDALSLRSAASTTARFKLAQNEFNDEWEDKRNELEDKIKRLEKERDKAEMPNEIGQIRTDLEDAQKDMKDHVEDEQAQDGTWSTEPGNP